MHKNPEKFGIKNVKPVSTIFQRKPDEVYKWIQRYTFDEIDGLEWKDKIQQIERSYRRLHQVQLELDLGGHDLHTLFFNGSRSSSTSIWLLTFKRQESTRALIILDEILERAQPGKICR